MVIPYPDEPVYPFTDGKPMAENTLQYRWITTIKGGMDVVFRDDPNVFIAGDMFWYPVRGETEIRTAPDTMIVFGRPKGDRLSYLQWREDDIPPQVVFEVTSPSNSTSEMAAKLDWYEQYGVREYYVYDPDGKILQGWIRQGDTLVGVHGIRHGFTSPLTGVHFKIDGELVLTGPDGRRFVDYPELAEQRDEAERLANEERERADRERVRAEQERERADRESRERGEAEGRARLAAEQAREETLKAEAAELQAREETRRATEAMRQVEALSHRAGKAEEAQQKAEDKLAKLRELLRQHGIDPDSLQ
jgi:Uma2 family endonuclease